MTVRIPLSGERGMLVDDQDAHLFLGQPLTVVERKRTTPSVRLGKVDAHRLIMDAPADRYVDHINGDGLDNRRANLRLCSKAENAKNRALNSNSTVGLKGVTRDPSGAYRAQIANEGRKITLGRFRCALAAAAAYDAAALRLHGEFARTNASIGLIQ